MKAEAHKLKIHFAKKVEKKLLKTFITNKSTSSIIDAHTGLLASSYFKKRIQEERNRAERTNLPFSLNYFS